MRVAIPEYSKLIASDSGEAVMSTPSWYHQHGDDSIVFVDAHRWPAQLTKLAGRVAVATRLPDGQWVCLIKRDGEWRISWFANIRATTPLHSEPPPIPSPFEDPTVDDGPFEKLHAFAGRLLGIAVDGTVWVRDDAGWSEHESLHCESGGDPRSTTMAGKPILELGGDVYDAQLEPIDVRDCTDLYAVGDRLLAVQDNRLVDYKQDNCVPVLPEHEVVSLDPGPRDTILMSFSRVDQRGTQYENALFDPRANTVTMLDKLGEFPAIVTFTDAGDIVLLDEDSVDDNDDTEYALWIYSATEIAALPHVPAGKLALPPRLRLASFDAYGAASRPLVATSGTTVAIALGTSLRFHTVDAPLRVHDLGLPIVAVASAGGELGALDWHGVLHTFDRNATSLRSRPAIEQPRSLTASGDAWLAIGRARVALIERERTRAIELAGALAAATDPDGGEILFACEDRRLVYWTRGELRDLPPPVEQIVALAPFGRGKFACVGEHEIYELDLAQGELVRINRQLIRPFVATHITDDKVYVATVIDTGAVDVGAWAGEGVVAMLPNSDVKYSGGYLEPAGEPDIMVHGLAFLDDGRLVILLDQGRGNIFDYQIGAALKLDPQPGDPRSRWMFFCGGKLLIAE